MCKVEQERQRQIMLILAAVGMLAGLGFYTAGNEEPTEEPEPVAAEPAASPGEKMVSGLEKADGQAEARNPFSSWHETAEERGEKREFAPDTEPAAAGKKGVLPFFAAGAVMRPAEPAKAGLDAEGKRAPELSLKGIVQGSEGRLALIASGGRLYSLSPGEMVMGWRLESIGENKVRISSEDGERQLVLPEF